MNICGRVGGRTVSETVRGLPGRWQRGEEPGGRPLALSPAVWREAGPHRELPARRACFSPACSGRCVLSGSGTAPWTPRPAARASAALTALGSLEHKRNALSGAGSLPGPRGRAPAHAVSPPPQSLPLLPAPPPGCLPAQSPPGRGCPVTPALHSARGCCHLVPLPVAP